ncbi:MAG: cobalamin B12-binding domain-containing protein [Rhodoferax sp.]|nr:cobalamin B12-binding domain-containing protein [Rhodoferax sp.]
MTQAACPVQALRDACATHTTQAIYARHGVALQRFGEAGRKRCHADVLHHMDYLASALALGHPAHFIQYVQWLREVLAGRGVPVAHLDFSLDRMAEFLADKLDGVANAQVQQILGGARTALALDAPVAAYGVLRLPPMPQASNYQASLLQNDRQGAMEWVGAAMDGGGTLAHVCVQVMQPAMYGVGDLWQKNRISVSTEHLASAICQNVLMGAYLRATFLPPVGKTAVFACVEGNHHALGLRMLSDTFETQGWDSVFLGADVPTNDLVRDIDVRRPQLLGLSAALPHHLVTARDTIAALRAELGNACPDIWIGGLASLSGDPVWRQTRADGWCSDALHAIDQL